MAHELVDDARVAKTHLDLRRMDVHIHRPWIERQKQEISGLPLPMQQLGIGLPHGVRNHPVAHIAAVDEEVLAICARLRRLWRAGKAGERHAAGGSLHHHARFGELAAEHRRGALCDRLAADVPAGAPVMPQRKADLRMREREAAEHLVAMAEFGLLALQEFAPRRRIEVEVLDRHRRAGGARSGLDFADIRAFGADHATVLRPFGAAADGEARHRGDRRERLAAKAHGGDALEIGEARDLARGVARERERQLVAPDAGAVVLDLDAPHAAFVERHRDRPRAGVERVLEQLLQHRSGPLDDFAGRDLAHQQIGKDANGGHDPSI